MFTLPDLPYDYDALKPYISARTMRLHYDSHHKGYLEKLNAALGDIDFEYATVEDVVKKTASRKDLVHVYNNAAQVSNHAFFWNCMTPTGGNPPTGRLKEAIDASFGDFERFCDQFVKTATGRFGSGYVWLVRRGETLAILDTANADPPFVTGDDPVLCCDLWEHAYYLDYQNGRGAFVEAFLRNLANWDFVTAQLDGELEEPRLAAAE